MNRNHLYKEYFKIVVIRVDNYIIIKIWRMIGEMDEMGQSTRMFSILDIASVGS